MRKTKKQRALELEQCLYRAEQGIHAMFRLVWDLQEAREKADLIRQNIINNMDLIKACARIYVGSLSKEMIGWDDIDAFLQAQTVAEADAIAYLDGDRAGLPPWVMSAEEEAAVSARTAKNGVKR